MANRVDITLNEANDENITLTISSNVPGLDLTSLNVSLEAFVKVSASTADNDASTWKGTTGTGEITVTATNKATVSVPGSALTTQKAWWRCDVLFNGKRKTACFGTLTVVDL